MRHLMLILFTASLAMTAEAGEPGQVSNYEAEGNLEITRGGDCTELVEVTNQWTPADLMASAKACANKAEYERTVQYYLLGVAYGRFDSLRVADRSAHQAVQVMAMGISSDLDEEQRAEFQVRSQELLGDANSIEVLACEHLLRMGMPDYFPRYMIQHGMSAFTGRKGDGLVEDFDPQAAWKEVTVNFAKCEPDAE